MKQEPGRRQPGNPTLQGGEDVNYTIERLIERYSNPGELAHDTFGGLMIVPYRATLKAAEREMSIPDLLAALD